MDITSTPFAIRTATAAARSVISLGKQLAAINRRAKDDRSLPRRILLYLRVAQEAVNQLGSERQRILHEASMSILEDRRQVADLWGRMHIYLHEDHVRTHFRNAMEGLRGCSAFISNQANKTKWRDKFPWRGQGKIDRDAAAAAFDETLAQLNALLHQLQNDFYPGGGSGIGVWTLLPIYDLITRVRDDHARKAPVDHAAATVELGKLVRKALEDKSHTEWGANSARVEGLIAQLHVAFNWTEELRAIARSPISGGARGAAGREGEAPRRSRQHQHAA